MANAIGTLNEGALHAGLKRWLARPGDLFEQPREGYVIDVVRGDMLIEIQTGNCAPLKKKLTTLLAKYRIRLVVPLARTRTILRIARDGSVLSRRRSPVVGRLEDLFERLVSIPALLAHEQFEIEVLEISEIERRTHERGKAWRRKGWVVKGRELVDVVERNLIRNADDLAALLPHGLPEVFTTEDIARLASVPRATAQQMVYCLRAVGALEDVDKVGNARRYRRVSSDSRSGAAQCHSSGLGNPQSAISR